MLYSECARFAENLDNDTKFDNRIDEAESEKRVHLLRIDCESARRRVHIVENSAV